LSAEYLFDIKSFSEFETLFSYLPFVIEENQNTGRLKTPSLSSLMCFIYMSISGVKNLSERRRQLNTAIYRITLCQIGSDRSGRPRNSKAREYFLRKISEGKTKKEALACLQRTLCDIIYAMTKNKTEYRFSRTVNSAA